jgi:L-asparaginase/Glu-tRNA(Gln) amidotransferase subunit D
MLNSTSAALPRRVLAAFGAAAALTTVLAGLGVGPASADTNTSTQKSTQLLCNVVLFSPGAAPGGCDNVQISNQDMVKNGTANTALVDYAKVELSPLLP